MSVEFHRESPGKFDPRTPNRKTLNRWTGRIDSPPRATLALDLRAQVATLQRGVQWIGGAVDWGSIIW